MYYISKFCRICVQTNVKLMDLDTVDFDKVKLSEKLEECTKMVVTRESLSTEICFGCVSKLRTSYQFLNMCKKSTKKLHGYYKSLLSKEDSELELKKIVNTDLNVVVSPVRTDLCHVQSVCEENDTPSIKEKRKRITKEQRCSLLKRLLTNPDQNKKEWDTITQKYNGNRNTTPESVIGGLKNIINFTRNYEFGAGSDKNSSKDVTPLDKLKTFSEEYFRRDFSEFKNTILYIIENKDNLSHSGDSEDEDFLNTFEEEEEEDSKENILKFEEIIIEPDIKIKTELDYEDGECSVEYNCNNEFRCKEEVQEEYDKQPLNNSSFCDLNYSDYPLEPPLTIEKVSSMMSLNNFVGNYQHKRTFSPSNVRCRTRANPYINPLLRQQFLYRSFRCEKCNRYFKSPGYLKAHYSKVH